MVSTWGTISWRGSMPTGSRIEIFTRSGNTETPDDTWSAWSRAYTQRRGLADHQPEGALSPVARRADRQRRRARPDIGHRRLSAAQHAAAGPVDHRSPAGHCLPEAVQHAAIPISPASRIRRTPDRKLTQAAQNSQGGVGSPSLGRRTYQKGLQTLVWRADDENDDELSYDVCYRREGDAGLEGAPHRRDRADSRVGHDDGAERHVLRQDRRVRRAVECGRRRR